MAGDVTTTLILNNK